MLEKSYWARVLSLIVYLSGLVALFHIIGHPITGGNEVDIILFSSLAVLTINLFIVEHFFETPKDVIGASLNALILLVSLYKNPSFSDTLFNVLFLYYSVCFIVAVGSALLFNNDESLDSKRNIVSNYMKKVATRLGNSKIIFSLLIAFLLIVFYRDQGIAFYSLVGIYLIVIFSNPIAWAVIDTIKFIILLVMGRGKDVSEPIGKMTAVQSQDTFIIDLIDSNKRPNSKLNLFDFVEFRYEVDDSKDYIVRCFIIDRYCLDNKQIIKVLKVDKRKAENKEYIKNVVYKVKEPSKDDLKILDSFVGTVIEKSDISQIRFEYSSKKLLTDGDLLKVKAKNKQNRDVDILYQVTQAITEIKCIENKNEAGLIVANATQLGVWQEDNRNFENYGWVPRVNSSVSIASEVKGSDPEEGELEVGKIENTNFKVIVNIKDLISHHTAILGTTGSGKSVFSRQLIRELARNDKKIFCVDLTGEVRKFLETSDLVDVDSSFTINGKNRNVGEHIGDIVKRRGSNYGKDPDDISIITKGIEDYIRGNLEEFLEQDKNVGVFELPELSNTEETLEYTKFFFKSLFDLAKEGIFKEKGACIVLEEAHTLIPEWNSVGGTDEKTARRVTNTIAQIALQGRKYNIGLMIIAQRTANVSKTILTQCNTIISFKQFDNTSRDFLTNHLGEDFVKSLPILKPRRAIIAGKALISDVPIIFKVDDIVEIEVNDNNENKEITEIVEAIEYVEVKDRKEEEINGYEDFNP